MNARRLVVASLCLSIAVSLAACNKRDKRRQLLPTSPPATTPPPTTPPPTTPPPTTPPPTTPPPSAGPLQIALLELAQTHVVPETGRSWTLSAAQEELHLVGRRDTLAIVQLAAGDAVNPQIEGWLNGAQLGTLPLSAALPPTEGGGPAYAIGRYAATLPAAWLAPGLQLRARADNYVAGAFRTPSVGADIALTLRILPFYVFGANEANTFPLATTGLTPQDVADEVYAKWPLASLVVQNHPARRVVWPILALPPEAGAPAFVARGKNEVADGFHTLRAMFAVIGQIKRANGEGNGPYQYYAPVLQLNRDGSFGGPGGGWGGGDHAVGDYLYTGIFIHEQGHATGLPHADEAYRLGKYPYVAGSLAGSAWGDDSLRREFLPPFLAATAPRYARCRNDSFDNTPRQIDAEGRCVKQDPMASGAGDQARGYRYATFADYNGGVMQRHLEGRTTLDSKGARVYEGGYITPDSAFASGYKRWDSIDRRWLAFDPVAETNSAQGLWDLNMGLPMQRDVPVHTIVLTYSLAGTAEVSQIYPVFSYNGNLIRTIDPTDAAQRASIAVDVNGAPFRRYCQDGGCDYTLRVTYSGGGVRHVLLRKGFRDWFGALNPVPATATNPTHANSFRVWAVNVPAQEAISKIELLDTPQAWKGLPANPTVLVTSSAPLMSAARAQTDGADAGAGTAGGCSELATIAIPASAAPPLRCRSVAPPDYLLPRQPRREDVLRSMLPRYWKR